MTTTASRRIKPGLAAVAVSSVLTMALGIAPHSPAAATQPRAAETASQNTPSQVLQITSNLDHSQWHLQAVNAEQAWTQTTGQGVIVAVVDTGIDPDAGQDEFAERILDGAQWQNGQLAPMPRNLMQDPLGHGTHVSGIIAASQDGRGITGIAPDAKILPIDIMQATDEEDFASALINALEYAHERGAHVANVSAGFSDAYIYNKDYAKRICETVEAVTQKGLVVVVSAGNDGDNSNLSIWPAGCPAALTVSALTSTLEPTTWTSFDYGVDVAAPGQDILSTISKESRLTGSSPLGYTYASGTSMAAPLVSGIAALVRQQHPQWSAQQIHDHIALTALDVAAPGKDALTGHGAVDAAKAVGVSAAEPQAQPWITLGARDDLDLAGTEPCAKDCLYVHWRPTTLEPERIELHLIDEDQPTRTYTYVGAVRATLTDAGPGTWLVVTAVYSGGDRITLLPQQISTETQWPEPEPPTVAISLKRPNKKQVTLTWNNTLGTRITKGHVDLLSPVDRNGELTTKVIGRVHLKSHSPARGEVTFTLNKRARSLDYSAQGVFTLSDGTQAYPYTGYRETTSPYPMTVTAEKIGTGWVLDAQPTYNTTAALVQYCASSPSACRGVQGTLKLGNIRAHSPYLYYKLTFLVKTKKLPIDATVQFNSLDGKLPRELKRAITAPVYNVNAPTFTRRAR